MASSLFACAKNERQISQESGWGLRRGIMGSISTTGDLSPWGGHSKLVNGSGVWLWPALIAKILFEGPLQCCSVPVLDRCVLSFLVCFLNFKTWCFLDSPVLVFTAVEFSVVYKDEFQVSQT